MNLFSLVYALSEKGKNDFKIKNTLQTSFLGEEDTEEDDDEDEDEDDDIEDPNQRSPVRGAATGPPQFFQVNKEEVVVLSNDRGSQIYLLGTNHASPESRLAVDALIKAITPHIVVVELCKTRIGLNPLKTFERNRAFNLYLLRDAVSELGISAGFIWYSMAYMERFISRLLNVDYGGDMRAPGTSASFQVTNADLLENKKNNYKIMLGDRPIEITIKRMASILTLPEKAAIWFFNICSAVLGLRCYLLNVPTVLFRSPKFNHVLLDERDVYLTYSLQMAANIANEPVRVIGIVGKAHVPGILTRWNRVSEEEVRRITTNEVTALY